MRFAMVLLGGLCAAVGGKTRAADVSFSGVLPNGALYSGPVTNMQEGRYRNMVREHTDYSCGATALATILRYAYHLDVDETQVIQGMMGVADVALVKQRGFSMLDVNGLGSVQQWIATAVLARACSSRPTTRR